MPSHKATFKWRTSKREITGQQTVVAEKGPCKGQTFKIGGIVREERSVSRGGIFVAKLVSTTNINDMNPEGVWQLLRADGSLHSHGSIDSWRAPKPSDEVLEEIAAGG